ncbi:helix-turn-helix domain-containing protein [Chitinophaga defluvii]|uniref:AraC family transcriptional regulator n=1 Tax=Chitinophaga defluvii TaxID=3163343 RepID=A0ABV2T4I5_9BACT
MTVAVQSINPEGIAVANGLCNLSDPEAIDEIDRINYAEGVVDTNKIIASSDLCFCYVNIDSTTDIDFKIMSETPALQMTFAISTSFLYNFEGTDLKVFNFNMNQHNLIYYPWLSCTNSWVPGQGQEMVDIILSAAFFEKYLPARKAFRAFTQHLEKGKMALLSPHNMPITPEMLNIIREIIHNNRKGVFKKMLVEAKVIELLMLQLEQFEEISGNPPLCSHLRKSEVERMQEVRNIILNNLSNPCSLIDLAHQVGTNEYNLKRAFKEVFGTTVFSYLNQAKMEKAKSLLISEELNVTQVADIMGYNDATNFTAAFKKHFGITPGKIKLTSF